MGFKEEMKREIRNIMKDAEKEVDKSWKIDYKGHTIEIINQIKEELLIIDGKIVDQNKRKSIFSHIIPYSTLSGQLELADGSSQTVYVKLGGLTKLNCIVKIGKKTILDESQKLEFIPWEHKEKIVPFIQHQVELHNKVVNDYLPDEELLFDENHPRLAAGLSDHLADGIPTPFFAKKLVKLFEEQINQPTTKTRKATYEKIIFDQIASYGPEFIERFQEARLDEALVQQEALWFLEHAAHREVVKFAITVLGYTNCEKYKELLFTLGLHEEFTPYVVFALKNGTSHSNHQVWQLAQSVKGWGKIAAVEQLDGTTPEIKHWILTEGIKNTISISDLAYTCAVNGELDIALYEDTISKELYDGAGLIIIGLLNEDTPISIDDYSYASTVLSHFVKHASMHCLTLHDFYPLMKISEFINDEEEIWEERYNNNHWKQHERVSIQEMILPIINDSKWGKLAIENLQHDFDYKVLEIARFYKMEVAPILFELLERYPTNSDLYVALMETENHEYIIKLCTFAENHLSLSSLSSDEEDCLQFMIQDLSGYEGVGLPLIKAALESDSGSLQFHALSILEAWSPTVWKQTAILTALQTILSTSIDKENRQLAKKLLKV